MTHEHPHVLVVDDDPDIREIVATRLRHVGYDVAIAGSGSSALDRIDGESFDVIVLDILMPGMDGHEVLEKLQDLGEAPSVIFLSALGQLEDRTRGLYEGAVDYMTKPFEPDELAARVAVAARVRQDIARARAESFSDALTGLENRAGFDEALDTEIARSTRYARPLALVYLDADGLKQTNDEHGHATGDELLRAVGAAIREACRQTDSPARIGGDEFAVILPETHRRQAEGFIVRLREKLAGKQIRLGDLELAPQCSIGIAIYPVDAEGKESLKRAADRELYRDKNSRQAVGEGGNKL